MSSATDQLICNHCLIVFPLNDLRWKCDCGSYLDIQFKATLNPEKIQKQPPSLWRYHQAIPVVKKENIITFGEGMTPLIEIQIQQKSVFLKLDFLFPSGSFKDRGASVLISKAKELGIEEVIEDSSGNAGAAIAAYGAQAGIRCHIYCPKNTLPAKLAQIYVYGAQLYRIAGERENASRAALEKANNLYYASHVMNPFFLQGTKTFAYEICEQLGWKSPDMVFLPVGNGTLLLGAHIGFKDLIQNDIINKMPRIIAVQSENCAPLYHLIHPETAPIKNSSNSIAEGIAIRHPRRGKQIVKAIIDCHGEIITVSENEIKRAMTYLSKRGLYVEPSSAVAVAGISRYLPKINKSSIVISSLTGHGLKTIR